MITVQLDSNVVKNQEMSHNYPSQANIPNNYLSAEEWRDQCFDMIDEIFDEYEKSLL